MENDNPVIYGLEFQTRALSAQTAETDIVRFLVGTQSLKFNNNQVHLVELNEETGSLKTQIFHHPVGEIWSLQASPTEPNIFITCYNALNDDGSCRMKGALWKLPELKEYTNNVESLKNLADIDTTPYGTDLKTIAYHPMDSTKAVSVVDNKFILWDLAENGPQVTTSGTLASKGQPRFTNGKWNPHNGCNQFVTLNENNVRGWDFRNPAEASWTILSAHSQIIRDLDFNVNRQYILSTCGDDGYMKFWDIRSPTEPILSRMEHSHWVWSVRINRFHDQLVLTSSSDSRVILCSIASISSEPFGHIVTPEDDSTQNDYNCKKNKLEDGVVGRYEEHEDSVYAVEWSSADPWTFASLSYDGRLVLNKVPRKYKYQILL
ncbi:EARP-interacting protein homolog isoform X1 [Bombus vancouverensis nearcticus]|uniref:EARP-interacting protein homolog n=1 Tax=Bombus bifarius TaxID=103933 RepID=A0A6P8N984_9HYME|nr:EARP-interacting protein homolog [Bombus vancouverensis nearcticus]XP_033311252.1 EARP-interacting protein homolog [Bombus bifarius]